MSEDLKKKREAIIAKVRALLAKTVENGCTEDEAMAAAALANKLMAEHDLAHGDIEAEVRAERYGARRRNQHGGDVRKRTSHPVTYCVRAVAEYFDCRGWQEGQDIVYFGSETDTEVAHVFTDMLRLAIDREWLRYLNGPERNPHVNGHTLRAAFMRGITSRLNTRIRELKAARNAASAPKTGTALVVLKGAVTMEKFAVYARQTGIRLRTTRRSFTGGADAANAYAAGKAAANRVDLGGAKLGAGPSPRIGGR